MDAWDRAEIGAIASNLLHDWLNRRSRSSDVNAGRTRYVVVLNIRPKRKI